MRQRQSGCNEREREVMGVDPRERALSVDPIHVAFIDSLFAVNACTRYVPG